MATQVSRSRTDITRILWEERQEATRGHTGTLPPMVVEKEPQTHRIAIPFKDEPELREQYVNFDGHLRFGKVMEDLDAFACNVAHYFADDNNADTRPVSLVTACVDEIMVHRGVEPLLKDNLELEGVVTWVGRSSIEVEATVNVDGQPAVTALFLLVGKDSQTGKTITVNRLTPKTEEAAERWNAGAMRNDRRREERKNDLFVVQPREDEVGLLHRLMLDATQDGSEPNAAGEPSGLAPVEMLDTRLWTCRLCQPQERNTAQHIFGGYLMRIGFELARANAYSFCEPSALQLGMNTMPMLLDVNDISFAHPVAIGNLLDLSSRVVYSNGASFQVRLEIRAKDLNNNAAPKPTVVTNVLHFTFACASASATDFGEAYAVPRVRPMNYRQGLLFLDGRRRMMAAKRQAPTSMLPMLPESFDL